MPRRSGTPPQHPAGTHVDEGAGAVGRVNCHCGPPLVRVVVDLDGRWVHPQLQRQVVQQRPILVHRALQLVARLLLLRAAAAGRTGGLGAAAAACGGCSAPWQPGMQQPQPCLPAAMCRRSAAAGAPWAHAHRTHRPPPARLPRLERLQRQLRGRLGHPAPGQRPAHGRAAALVQGEGKGEGAVREGGAAAGAARAPQGARPRRRRQAAGAVRSAARRQSAPHATPTPPKALRATGSTSLGRWGRNAGRRSGSPPRWRVHCSNAARPPGGRGRTCCSQGACCRSLLLRPRV